MRQLVLVHGRAQENKNSVALKAEWLETLARGLAKSNLILPIPEQDVRFPFYGDTLSDLVAGKPADNAAAVIVRGKDTDDEEKRFAYALLEEIRKKAGITDDQLTEVAGQNVVEHGPLNWEWVRDILKAIDRYVPGASSTSIILFTHDVYQYLTNTAIRTTIDAGVQKAITPGIETVVVAHSLGTVVAYNILRQGHDQGWKIPLYVTVGSPLAVTEIKNTLKSFATIRCPECVSGWFNAMDEADVVSLYPLDTLNFPLYPHAPAIRNKTNVQNNTDNHHGITGYLDDKVVAKSIYDALVA